MVKLIKKRSKYGVLLYDNARYKAGKIRKKKELIQYRKKKRNHLIYGILLFAIITLIILSATPMGVPVIYLLLLGIVMYSLWIIFIVTISFDLKKSHILSTLNIKIYEKAIIMPDWETIQPTQTKIYPMDLIDKIYWNEGYDHLLFIKSELGIRISKNRLKHEMLYKNIIDNEEEFKRALRKSGKLNEDEKMDISEWLKRKKKES